MVGRTGERQNRVPNRVVGKDGQEWFGVGALSTSLNRSVRSVYRLEIEGVLPRPRRTLKNAKGKVIGVPHARWYSKEELDLLHQQALSTGFLHNRNRAPEFKEAIRAERERRSALKAAGEPVEGIRGGAGGDGAQKSDVRSHAGWEAMAGDAFEGERGARPWGELSGEEPEEEQLDLDDVLRCDICSQEMYTEFAGPGAHASLASLHCPTHGRRCGVSEPEPVYLAGPRTTAEAMSRSAAARWGNASETQIYGSCRGQ